MFSGFSLVMSLLLFTVFTAVCGLISKKAGWHTLKVLGIGILLTVLRCFLPMEFPGAKIISIKGLVPKIYIWTQTPFYGTVTPMSIMLYLWGSISLMFLCRLGVRLWRQKKAVLSTPAPRNCTAYRIYRETLHEISCPKSGILAVAPSYRTVMMTGFFRPDIVLPDCMEDVAEAEMKIIFRHEIFHYLCHDLWIKLLIEILCCLLWWNPIVYLLRTSVGQLLELRCDRRVCRYWSMEQRTSYSETLIRIFQKQTGKSRFISAGYLGYSSSEHIKQRFAQILYAPSRSDRQQWLSEAIIVFAVTLFFLSYTFIFLPSAPPPGLETGDVSISEDSETDFILKFPDGKLELYINNKLYAVIREDDLKEGALSKVPIYDVYIDS